MLPRNTEPTSLNGSTSPEDNVLVQEFRKGVTSASWNDFCWIVTMTLHLHLVQISNWNQMSIKILLLFIEFETLFSKKGKNYVISKPICQTSVINATWWLHCRQKRHTQHSLSVFWENRSWIMRAVISESASGMPSSVKCIAFVLWKTSMLLRAIRLDFYWDYFIF